MKFEATAEQRERLLNRLARLEGQVRGVKRLVESGQDCELVLQQTAAARKALDRAFFEMLACLVEGTVVNGEANKVDTAKFMGEVRELMTRYA
jgi:DNA-binding FrmR family transcriptional regulator